MDEKKSLVKPLSLVITEMKQTIVNDINQFNIPIYLKEMILKDMLNDIIAVSNQVKESEYQEYYKTLEVSKKADEK